VVTARGGQEGLRLVRELRPAAVTLDIMMPDLDGRTVLAAIKGDPALASIKPQLCPSRRRLLSNALQTRFARGDFFSS
jgi:CheY-like chemotaxis protein